MTLDTFSEPYVRDEDIAALPDVRHAIQQLQDARRAAGTPLSGRIIQVSHYLPVVATFLNGSGGAGAKRHGLLSPPETPEPPATPASEDAPSTSTAGGRQVQVHAEYQGGQAQPAQHQEGRADQAQGQQLEDRAQPAQQGSQSQPQPQFHAPPPSQSQLQAQAPTSSWRFTTRAGHDAMVSGIRSLAATHEQLWVGWTGDVLEASGANVVSVSALGSGAAAVGSAGVGATSVANAGLEDKDGHGHGHGRGYGHGRGRPIPSDSIMPEDRAACEEALLRYRYLESESEGAGAGAGAGVEDDDERDEEVHGEEEGHGQEKTNTKPGAKQKQKQKQKQITLKPVWLSDTVAHRHYEGYSKHTLWPLFHYLLWQDVASELSTASDAEWDAYLAANQAYADALVAAYRPGDLIWVHDYHLLLLPKLLRAQLPDAHVGLFVHTPFPSSEVFRCLPRRREILDGMLGANLVCFQTYSYARHFTSSCIRVCGYETNPTKGGIETPEGHVAAVCHCPVGVDAERVARDTLRPGISPKLEALKALYEGKKIIVGRDKLDVVRGVLHKLHAFEKLLLDYPHWRSNVVFIQVTSPSPSDVQNSKLERQISELVSRINGEFGSLDFIPVHHYHQHLKKDEFYALLSVADLGVITPLRDGMNTTSMEFVIAQRRTGNAPLVLSEFMGITGFMKDALQVNPWNLGDVAAAMNRGLTMSAQEKSTRQEGLYKVVTTHTSHHWAANLVKMLLEQLGAENALHQTPYLDVADMRRAYERAGKRLLLFDYDGTLTPIVRVPSQALPSQQTLRTLALLAQDPKNVVYIISGRDASFLCQHLGDIKGMGLSAEHGCFIKEPGSEEWFNLTQSLDMEWMEEVREIFEYYTERTTGSTVEGKKSSITWHYRGADPEWGQFQCRQCLDLLENNLVHKRPIEVLVGKKNLEVRPVAVNKGEIVKRIMYNHPDAQFVFCAGDDKTDEDMFRSLNLPPAIDDTLMMAPPVSASMLEPDRELEPVEIKMRPEMVFSTTVGASSKKTLARWHVTSPGEVVDAIESLVGGTQGREGEGAEAVQGEGIEEGERCEI